MYSIIWKKGKKVDKGLSLNMHILKDGVLIGESNGYPFKNAKSDELQIIAKQKIAELEAAALLPVPEPVPEIQVPSEAEQLAAIASVLDKPITK